VIDAAIDLDLYLDLDHLKPHYSYCYCYCYNSRFASWLSYDSSYGSRDAFDASPLGGATSSDGLERRPALLGHRAAGRAQHGLVVRRADDTRRHALAPRCHESRCGVACGGRARRHGHADADADRPPRHGGLAADHGPALARHAARIDGRRWLTRQRHAGLARSRGQHAAGAVVVDSAARVDGPDDAAAAATAAAASATSATAAAAVRYIE